MAIDKTIITYAIFAIVGLILINKIMNRIIPGAWWEKSEEDIKEEAEEAAKEARINEVFSPSFSLGTPPYSILPRSYLETLAKQIKDSWGLWNDDEATIFNVFHDKIKMLTQVSQLAKTYSNLYNENLLTVLKQNLSKKEFNQLWQGIKDKPVGK